MIDPLFEQWMSCQKRTYAAAYANPLLHAMSALADLGCLIPISLFIVPAVTVPGSRGRLTAAAARVDRWAGHNITIYYSLFAYYFHTSTMQITQTISSKTRRRRIRFHTRRLRVGCKKLTVVSIIQIQIIYFGLQHPSHTI